jgi:hypothetical protein
MPVPSLSSGAVIPNMGNFADAAILKTFGEVPANLDELWWPDASSILLRHNECAVGPFPDVDGSGTLKRKLRAIYWQGSDERRCRNIAQYVHAPAEGRRPI